MLTVDRLEQQPTQSHHAKGLLSTDTHSEKNDSPGSRPERCCGNGQDRFRKDGCFRDTHDREIARP